MFYPLSRLQGRQLKNYLYPLPWSLAQQALVVQTMMTIPRLRVGAAGVMAMVGMEVAVVTAAVVMTMMMVTEVTVMILMATMRVIPVMDETNLILIPHTGNEQCKKQKQQIPVGQLPLLIRSLAVLKGGSG
jgi:hypothetical protein